MSSKEKGKGEGEKKKPEFKNTKKCRKCGKVKPSNQFTRGGMCLACRPIRSGARMLYFSSGRHGFDYFKSEKYNSEPIEKNKLISMYERENELRVSDSIQSQFTKASDSQYIKILDKIQFQVLSEFGFEETRQNLERFRESLGIYSNDEKVKNTPIYSKYNRCKQGTVKVGDLVPQNLQLFDLSNEKKNLFDFTKNQKESPLVILSGSKSWPPFMQSLIEFNEMIAKYTNKNVTFCFVYLSEAHAKDEWPVGELFSTLNQHKNIEQRIEAAKSFVKENKIDFEKNKNVRIVVDNMNNDFSEKFGAWPYRFFGIESNKLMFKPEPDLKEYGYPCEELEQWLEQITK